MSALAALASLLREPPRPKLLVGVYLLICGEEIVYVGKSRNIASRLYGHRLQREIGMQFSSFNFDRAAWIEVDGTDLDAYESAIIRSLRPKYNSVASYSDPDRDDAIVATLGLPPITEENRGRYFLRGKRAA